MKKLMPLIRIIIVLVISYFLFIWKFDFTNSQAYWLIFLLVIILIVIGRNSYAENKNKVKFEPHYIGITFYLKPILHEIGLSEQKIKEFFKVYEKLEKWEKINNKNLRPNWAISTRTLTKDDIYMTSKMTEDNWLNFSAISLLDSWSYLMVNNNAKTIGWAFTTNISCHWRIDLIEWIPYTDIYFCKSEKWYEIWLIDLDTKEYAMMWWNRETEVFYHKERCKILWIIPYELVHHQRSTIKQYQKACKTLEKYKCELEVYEDSSYHTINNDCFRVNYWLIDD